MKNEVSLSSIQHSVSKLFYRYHITMFIVLVIGCLIAVTLTLSITASHREEPALSDQASAQIFDEEVINRLESLKTAEEQPPNPSTPFGKRNPFVE